MTENNQEQKTVAIQTIYVKDVSFEAPNSPGVFMEENIQPETKINLSNTHNKIGENSYDVSLTIKAEASYGEKTMFIAEVEQSGVFVMNGYDDQEIKDLIAVYCPSTLFPYAREILSSMVAKGGFLPSIFNPLALKHFMLKQKKSKSNRQKIKCLTLLFWSLVLALGEPPFQFN